MNPQSIITGLCSLTQVHGVILASFLVVLLSRPAALILWFTLVALISIVSGFSRQLLSAEKALKNHPCSTG